MYGLKQLYVNLYPTFLYTTISHIYQTLTVSEYREERSTARFHLSPRTRDLMTPPSGEELRYNTSAHALTAAQNSNSVSDNNTI